MDESWKKVAKWTVIGAAVLVLALILLPVSCVGTTDRGVKTRYGAVVGQTLQPGIVIRWPFIEGVKTFTYQPQPINLTVEPDEQGAITRDLQTVGASMQLMWRYRQEQIPEVARNWTEEKIRAFITYNTVSALKSTLGTYSIYDLPAVQLAVSKAVHGALNQLLAAQPFEITDCKLTNYDWQASFDEQITQTNIKAQQVKQKTQELEIADLESQKQIKVAASEKTAKLTRAEADKQAAITAAEGEKEVARLEADAKALEGEGIRRYNASIASTLDTQLKMKAQEIELERIKKWNGAYVPENHYGPIPFQAGGLKGD